MAREDEDEDNAIVFQTAGKAVRLSTSERLRKAIVAKDLTPDAWVEVEQPGGVVATKRAYDVPRLKRLFDEAGAAPEEPSEPDAPEPPQAANDPTGPAGEPGLVDIQLTKPAADSTAVAAEAAATTAAAPDAAATDGPPPAKPKPVALIVGLGIAAVLLLILFLTLMLRGGDKPAAPEVPASNPTTPPEAIAAPAQTALDPGAMVAWTEADGAPKTFVSGPVSITLSAATASDGGHYPVLEVSGADAPAIQVGGVPNGAVAKARFGVFRLDPGASYPEVVFTSYTGKAHCCTAIYVVEQVGGAWKNISLGQLDGEPIGDAIKDVDGDGVPDIVLSDNRFLYAFDSYARSLAPPRILNIKDGEAVDVTADPRYAALIGADMTRAEAECRKHHNGACAAFVADASRLGQLDRAWPIMMQSYDRSSHWKNPVACNVPAASQDGCPAGARRAFATYPEALAWFLSDAGYPVQPIPPAAPPADDGGAQASNPGAGGAPSYDCSGVASENLQLICATPELAALDRRLAAAYQVAMAGGGDDEALRRDQRAWIVRRNNAATDVGVLRSMYEQRIAQLEAIANQ